MTVNAQTMLDLADRIATYLEDAPDAASSNAYELLDEAQDALRLAALLPAPPQADGVREALRSSRRAMWEALNTSSIEQMEKYLREGIEQTDLAVALSGKPGAEPQRPADALRLLAELFSESLHETWTRGEIVAVIEDAIRLGSSHARPESESP